MGRIKNNYKEVDKLPGKAKTVKQYAAETGTSAANIFTLYKRGQNAGWEIVSWQGICFVIEKKNK